MITTAEAASRLGLTVRAVQKMIEAGRLSAQKVGRDYLIAPDALENIPKQAAGRPPKAKTGTSSGQDGRVIVTKKGGKKP
jgi:excisionase family DNA binding protein